MERGMLRELKMMWEGICFKVKMKEDGEIWWVDCVEVMSSVSKWYDMLRVVLMGWGVCGDVI